MNQDVIELLPEDIADKVIKINLHPGKGEETRAILYVPAGSCIYEHSHEEGKNECSELYANLLNSEGELGINENTAVAGSNSPSNRKIHGVVRGDYPRIILAIKKKNGESWENFKENVDCESLGLEILKLKNGPVKIVSDTQPGQAEENVVIYPNSDTITYYTGKIVPVCTNLSELLGQRSSSTEQKNQETR